MAVKNVLWSFWFTISRYNRIEFLLACDQSQAGVPSTLCLHLKLTPEQAACDPFGKRASPHEVRANFPNTREGHLIPPYGSLLESSLGRSLGWPGGRQTSPPQPLCSW